ncbi:REP-associated tyrosine transposase [Pseudomonas sp. zfem005]|uniref:REP-associated tyrosine transposase n=1 Tax=Pseudomonas sp. zfem005 TaxID=3078200 RepID=UPI002927F594|nr:transposase [Pseudomonas sp. zfem005]MDU9411965.1 transposase [Pseudomonas sp. zfem005]
MRYRRSFVPGGTYFFTVNLADRSSGLLTRHIDLLRLAVRQVRARHPFEIPAMVVLPDHLHAIWSLPEGDADFSLRWAQIKGSFSRWVPERGWVNRSRRDKRERGIWQRRFWEHQIRDEQDLARHVDYIHINPVKHGHVRRAVDWPYSSIHRFIRDGRLPADWACDPLDGQFGETT